MWTAFFDMSEDGEVPTYWLTENFWRGEDSVLRQDAKLFDSYHHARRAVALHMLANSNADPKYYRIERTHDVK